MDTGLLITLFVVILVGIWSFKMSDVELPKSIPNRWFYRWSAIYLCAMAVVNIATWLGVK